MLPEEKRQQLDGIVQQMVQNKEPDSNIRFVVDDFKAKYTQVESNIDNRSLSQKTLDVGTKVSNFFGGKGLSELAGATIAKIKATPEEKKFIDFPKAREVVGSATQLGANFIPGAGIGAGIARKVATGAATGLSFDVGSKLQKGETPTPGLGTAVGATLPIGGAGIGVAKRLVGRLLRGLGSGLGGVPTKTIDAISQNPQMALKATQQLSKSGSDKILEQNSRAIINGISQIKNEARSAFGKGLEQLSKEDINPTVFKDNTKGFLDKYGVSSKKGIRSLGNVEFSDPKNIKKASELIDRLSRAELDGKSLRKLADDIENAKFKTATSDERLSFNAFIKDMSSALKNAISSSTDKLGEINKRFSQDMQLAETAEQIFGKVNFRNLPEVVKASQKLESMFSQKGLAPGVVDDFLTRIGIAPTEFKVSEAVRQLSTKESPSNSPGASVGEIVRGVTGAIVTPQAVRNIAIFTGLSEKTTQKLMKIISPAARNILLNAVVENPSPQQ